MSSESLGEGIQTNYRQALNNILRAMNLNYKCRLVLPEEVVAVTEADVWEWSQRISHYRHPLLWIPSFVHKGNRILGETSQFVNSVIFLVFFLLSMESQARSSRNARKIGGCEQTLCQPFAKPVPTLRQPVANPSPTFSANSLSKPLFPWTPQARV